MIKSVAVRERIDRFVKNVIGALGHCALEEVGSLADVLLAIACIGVLWIVGTITYELIFDPHATNIAAALDALSINPDKWFPRS